MSAPYRASVYADPPVYAAGRASTYAVPGAATRRPTRNRAGFVIPSAFFAVGGLAGALVSIMIIKAVLK